MTKTKFTHNATRRDAAASASLAARRERVTAKYTGLYADKVEKWMRSDVASLNKLIQLVKANKKRPVNCALIQKCVHAYKKMLRASHDEVKKFTEILEDDQDFDEYDEGFSFN